jgi:deoxyribonuclease V
MRKLSDFFPYDHSRESLLEAQKHIAEMVIDRDEFGELRFIAGVDQAFMDDLVISGIVVLRNVSSNVADRSYSVQPVNYPYIPTFLSFREGPAIVNAFKKLKTIPDILMVDGAGINHPRRAGIATHIGVVLDVPTIGITKKILCGSGEYPLVVGGEAPLIYKGHQVGWLLKTNKKSRPIIVAPGHRVSLRSSLLIVRACLHGYKLPEPLRFAHDYANDLKMKLWNDRKIFMFES